MQAFKFEGRVWGGTWTRKAAFADRHEYPLPGSPKVAHHFLKNPIDCAHMKMRMLVQVSTKPVDESDGTDVQGGFAHIRSTWGVGLDVLRSSSNWPSLDSTRQLPVLHRIHQETLDIPPRTPSDT